MQKSLKKSAAPLSMSVTVSAKDLSKLDKKKKFKKMQSHGQYMLSYAPAPAPSPMYDPSMSSPYPQQTYAIAYPGPVQVARLQPLPLSSVSTYQVVYAPAPAPVQQPFQTGMIRGVEDPDEIRTLFISGLPAGHFLRFFCKTPPRNGG